MSHSPLVQASKVSLTRRGVLVGVGMATAAGLLVACTAGGNGGQAGSGGGSADSLLINTVFVYSTLDPGYVYEQTAYVALHGIYDTLMTWEGNDLTEPVPLAAESYEVNEDLTEHTFVLRDDVTFSDGTPMTSEDVLFSVNRMVNLQGSSSNFFAGLTFDAPDESTFVVESDEPMREVPVLFAMPATSIVNSAAAIDAGAVDTEDAVSEDSAQATFDQASFGSGPYQLESNDPGNEMVLVPNENYWGETDAGFERVVFRNVDVQNQSLSASRAEGAEIQLDLTGHLLDDLPDSLQITSSPDTVYLMYMSTDPEVSEATANDDWRRALRASLDYEGIADLFGEGGSQIAGFLAGVYPGALPESEYPERDLDAAREALEASGVGDEPVRFIYPSITYRGVDLATITTKIQTDAAEAGINLELTPLAMPAFLDEQRGGDVVMGFTPHSLVYPLPEALVSQLSPGGTNAERVRWMPESEHSEEALAAAAAIHEAADESERIAALEEWQHLMIEVSPFMTVAQNSGTVVATSEVVGAEHTAAGWQIELRDLAPAQ